MRKGKEYVRDNNFCFLMGILRLPYADLDGNEYINFSFLCCVSLFFPLDV